MSKKKKKKNHTQATVDLCVYPYLFSTAVTSTALSVFDKVVSSQQYVTETKMEQIYYEYILLI